jgi:hypothetical protein
LANVVFTCASSKSFPITLYARYFTKEEWLEAIQIKKPRYPVWSLYKGPYWKEVLKVYEKYKKEHQFWVLSAGLGLVKFEDNYPSYNASFSKRSEDTVPIGWVPLPRIEGIISASNEYLEAAELIGLQQLKPSGRKWLNYFGGTAFTLSPKLMDLYLSGEDLQKIYNSLPDAAPQPLAKRQKPTTDILEQFYRPGISPTKFRKQLNNAGYAISVENAYKYVQEKNQQL